MNTSLPWFAVHVRSNFERKASGIVARKCGCEVYTPSYTIRSRRRGEEHELSKPLFPGYFFVNLDLLKQSRNEVLGTSGVVSIVAVKGRPVAVDPEVMQSLRILCGQSDRVRPHPYLRQGMQVRVRHGPLAGARGMIVEADDGRASLVVSIHILGRSVSVAVDRRDVEPDPLAGG